MLKQAVKVMIVTLYNGCKDIIIIDEQIKLNNFLKINALKEIEL